MADDAHLDSRLIAGAPKPLSREPVRQQRYDRTKRLMDIVGSIVGLVVGSPLYFGIALLVRLTSRGPVLFLQKRAGRGGKTFVMYKFRTMRESAEREIAGESGLVEWDGPVFRVRDDARVTWLGKKLRKFSLDELPQLFNVLKGDMSLVGPRPHLIEEADRYEPWHRQRLACRPGLTCYWQACPDRHNIVFDEWIRMDLRYIEERSLLLDLRIMLRTALVVLKGQ